MLVGVFRFIFFKLPSWILNLIKEWSPTFFKFIKVIFLVIVLVSIIIFPSSYAITTESDSLNFWMKLPMYLWSILAILGAVWGIRKIELQENGVVKALKAVFSKNSETDKFN